MGKNNGLCSGVSSGSKAGDTEGTGIACLFSLSPKQFSLLSSLIGLLLIDNLDANQQNSLGNFIVGIGQAILTSVSQQQLLESGDAQGDRIQRQVRLLKEQICMLEESLVDKDR